VIDFYVLKESGVVLE